MSETLKLVLKKKWFDMIASGKKTEEYREIKDYYIHRICMWSDVEDLEYDSQLCPDCKNTWFDIPCSYFDYVTFYLGYQKNRPQMTFEIESISIGKGKEEWGAEKNKYYFVIKLGKRI